MVFGREKPHSITDFVENNEALSGPRSSDRMANLDQAGLLLSPSLPRIPPAQLQLVE